MRPLREAIGDLSNPGPDTNMYWAQGCADCRYGIVLAPPRTGAVSLYAERLVQASDQSVEFCDCRAGHMARQHMRKLWQTRQADGQLRGVAGTLDEVAWARSRIEHAYRTMDVTTPTIQEAA